jgi:cytochrome c oxidase subunit II
MIERFGPLLPRAFFNAGGGSFWMPVEASTVAPAVDWLFYFIFGISLFFFVLIAILMFYFLIRYRRRGEGPAAGASHNTALEITWTAIPVVLVGVIFYFGFRTYLNISTAPENAYEVLVTGQKWKWLFTYPNGHVDENLHVAIDQPVRLVLSSEDVIHSLFIPAFRLKRDAVPGRYNKTWFQATRVGEFPLLCSEFCGTGHSDMVAKVVVHPAGDFEKWLSEASNILAKLPPAQAGEQLYKTRGCPQCHSVDGKTGIGPSLYAVFGAAQALRGGARAVADENYIRESIVDPPAKVVAGFDPVMPSYKGRLKDAEITAVIEYLKTLRPAAGGGTGR